MDKIWRPLVNNTIDVLLRTFISRKAPSLRLLIIKLEVLGDFIIFLPALIRYKEIYPDYKISLLISHAINYPIAERLKGMGYIDEVILFNDTRFAKNPIYRFKFSARLYHQNFKKVIYQVYFRRYLGDFLVKISHSLEAISFAGYRIEVENDEGFSDMYTNLIHLPKEVTSEFDRNKYLVEKLADKKFPDYAPIFPLTEDDLKSSNKILEELGLKDQKLAVLFPGAGLAFKCWPAERFAEIADFLIDLGITPVICGTKNEELLAKKIISKQKKTGSVNLVGKTDLFSLGAILKRSLFYFGNDTGIAHLSAAVHTPTLVIMGGGAFKRFFPYGDLSRNRIIYQHDMSCENDSWKCVRDRSKPAPCIEAITVDQAKSEINNLLTYLNDHD